LKNSAAHLLPREAVADWGCALVPVATPEGVAGVDVGEDFLDVALLRIGSAEIEHRRIALDGIDADLSRMLVERLRACCPDLTPKWLALIDSPRWPLDLDYSSATAAARNPVPGGRLLDGALRSMLRRRPGQPIQLSMFPTPPLEYFTNCASMKECKPHLRAIYLQLLGEASPLAANASASLRGGTFTRFMLAGFLTFRAFREMGVETLEAYPELQFRLANHNSIPPKRSGRTALTERIGAITRLREAAGVLTEPPPKTLDQADAEILALSAALASKSGSLAALEHPAEGRFLITFQIDP
jgi:hypothetical protein